MIPPAVSPSLAALQGRIAEIQSRMPSPGFAAALSRAQSSAGTAATADTGVATAAAAPAPTWATAAASPVTAPTRAGAVTGERIVAIAKQHLGTPYVWGGTDPDRGLDCSGLVQVVYREAGIELPRVSRDQARAGRPVASLAEARPGDLVAFGSPVDHIGIYAGGGKMVVAPRTGDVVKVQDIGSRTITAIRRVLP